MKCNNTLCKRHLTSGECVKLLGEECQYEQLIKAKEIIIKCIEYYLDRTNEFHYEIITEAEQFLKEMEK